MSDAPADDPRFLLLAPNDNVVVAREEVGEGSSVIVGGVPVALERTIPRGHKIACRTIAPGEKVLKYGAPIGSATATIRPGQHVHLHNLKSDYTATHIIASVAEKAS